MCLANSWAIAMVKKWKINGLLSDDGKKTTKRHLQLCLCGCVCALLLFSWLLALRFSHCTKHHTNRSDIYLFASLYIYFCCGYLLFVSDLSLKHKCFFLIFCVECVCFVASNLRFFRRCQDLPIKTKKFYLFCDVPKYIIVRLLWGEPSP